MLGAHAAPEPYQQPGCSMAYYSNRNLAYDFTLFEEPYVDGTSARVRKKTEVKSVDVDDITAEEKKDEPEKKSSKPKKTRIKRVRRRKSNFGRIAVAVLFGIAVVVIVASIIHGQVQLTELNQEIIDARAELSEKQSIYTQLEMKVDSSISTSVVEEYAQETLDMNKASNSQKEFINLSEGDKAEVTMSEDKNIFRSIAEAIASLWS